MAKMKEYKYKINGNNYNVAIGDIDDNIVEVLVNGTPYKVELEKKAAPPPGTILSVNCKVGDTVKASDTVIMLEAMKMENAIHAGRDGKVASISVNNGDSVLEGAVLVTLE